MPSKELHFRTNILLKDLVGKDLINDDNIAIVELVKNSIDAGSKKILVKFTNLTSTGELTETSQIIISDRGSGMSLVDIETKWLNIAYSDKKYIPQVSGAFLAGNKGVGRFSCDRLGRQLNLLTRKKGGRLLHLPIDWTDFEIQNKADLTIQEIDLKANTINEQEASKLSGLKFPAHGTVLVVSNLRSQWNKDKLRKLKTALEKFLNPNQLFTKERLEIELSASGLNEESDEYSERINGVIQNQIFSKLQFNTTYIEARILGSDTVEYKLWHEGEMVFELIEKNTEFRLLQEVYIVIYFLNTYKKAYFKRQTGIRLVDFGSIFLFLNGFRIPPYGDRGNDWLNIDVRKAQGTRRYLGSRDIVGRIEIQGNEDDFSPISSREGLKETRAYEQLKSHFFLSVLRKLEKFVVDGLNWDSVPRDVAKQLRKFDGYDWRNTIEEYSESWERKQQRIALSLMTLIGSDPDQLVKFWFNPALLENLYEGRAHDVEVLLNDIEGIGLDKADPKLKRELSRFRNLIREKEGEAKQAKEEAANLREELSQNKANISKLEQVAETYKAQTLFLRQATSTDVQQLLTFHHEIRLASISAAQFLERTLEDLSDKKLPKQALDRVHKTIFILKKIGALARYASKANFRAETNEELTDLPAYIEQYIQNVVPDFLERDIKVTIENTVKELFEVKASRIALSILVDNIIGNSRKAGAKNLIVRLSKPSKNRLVILFIDNGPGLSKKLPSTESIFEPGITTTPGSGLGLFHVKTVVEELGGVVSALSDGSGLTIKVEITK